MSVERARARVAAARRELDAAIEELLEAQAAPRAEPLPPSFAPVMSREAYAAHAGISTRKLDYVVVENMTEGVHYSRVGRRVRIHVAEADALLRAAKPVETDDLEALARDQASRAERRRSPKRAA